MKNKDNVLNSEDLEKVSGGAGINRPPAQRTEFTGTAPLWCPDCNCMRTFSFTGITCQCTKCGKTGKVPVKWYNTKGQDFSKWLGELFDDVTFDPRELFED